jgi:uncharacterized protein YjbJ (UPF0337 family)
MDKDRIKGSAEQAKGALKEAAGKVLGDKKLELKARPTRLQARYKTRSVD